MKHRSVLVGWFSMLLFAGCSNSPAPLRAPGIDRGASAAAISKYDANSDGAIGGDELAKAPSLKASLKRVDKSGDGKVTAEEIDERIEFWQHSGLALTGALATVRQSGQPVSGAEVTFVPEEFLGANIKPARGTTNADGMCNIKISSHPDERGVHLGFYRVHISKKGPDGKEMVPARYNFATEFGVEVSPDNSGLDHLSFDISGR